MVYISNAGGNKRRRSATLAAATIAINLAVSTQALPATPDTVRVRSTNPELTALVREGSERSATFERLVNAIGRSNGIVYIEFGYCARARLNGCVLPYLASSQGDRYLRVVLTPDGNRRSRDQLLGLIAHELRHVYEILEHPDVVDVATMEALYRRIGTPETGGLSGYETSAARAAGDAVIRELQRSHQTVAGNVDTHEIAHPLAFREVR
jgi:hypothetical protein